MNPRGASTRLKRTLLTKGHSAVATQRDDEVPHRTASNNKPGHEYRMALYEARALWGLPLFEPPESIGDHHEL